MEYKELFNRAKAAYGTGAYDDATLEFIFPELTESEDERIKKIITDSVFFQYGAGVEYKDVLDYLDKLEKQKEQKPITSCDIVPYIDDKIAALQDMWREEKVAFDWDDMHEMIEDVARHFYQKDQKPRDYRKLYEEVVNSEWFKKAYVGKSLGEEQKLAENEDERIGNVIYCIVRDNKEVKRILEGNGVSVDNALAYLEKQKEQKPIDPCDASWDAYYQRGYERGLEVGRKEQKPAECGCTNDESEYDKGYREGHKFGLKQTQEYMLPGGKIFSGLIPCWVNAPSELQPAHKYHGRNAVIMHENNGGFRCCFIDDDKPVTIHLPEDTLFVEGWRKRPSEWSEEDEKTLVKLLDSISIGNNYEEMCDWLLPKLKSLRDRPKPSDEKCECMEVAWSEEDEEKINNISEIIEHCIAIPYSGGTLKLSQEYKKELQCFLKSIRPSWKPSEEQMEAFKSYIEDFQARAEAAVGGWNNFDVMIRLYEQLKKL